MKRIICLSLVFALTVFTVFAGGKKERAVDTVTGASSVFDYSLGTAVTGTGSGITVYGGADTTTNTVSTDNAGRNIPTIVIYTSMYENIVESVKNELGRQFPQYNIVFIYGQTGAIQAKIEGERGSGRLGCDLLLVAEPSYSIELKANGMLQRFRPAEASNLAFNADPEGYWYPVRINNMVLAYNPDKNNRNALPTSFYGFANDERVRGAISMTNPITSGTSTATVAALLEKYGYTYYAALRNQNVAVEPSDTAITKLESGEYKLIMVLEESILRRRQEQESRLEVIYPSDGTVIIPSNIMIVNNKWSANRNAQAAEAIANWFLSPAGQSVIVSGWMHSVRSNFDRLPHGARPTNDIRANSIRVNWDFVFRQRDMIRIRFEDQILNRTRQPGT
jgi:iron(III) transport system substrate-binding protein